MTGPSRLAAEREDVTSGSAASRSTAESGMARRVRTGRRCSGLQQAVVCSDK